MRALIRDILGKLDFLQKLERAPHGEEQVL